jgi:metallo-beta-lactamase family protein
LTVKLIFSAHILGSSFVVISDEKNKLTFSGDLGRPNQLIMKDPPIIRDTDYLVLESTYGDKIHTKSDPFLALEQAIHKTIKKSGILIIPAFAVERSQLLLYCLAQLKSKNRIPDIPIYLDSPMAIAVTELFCQFKEEHILQESLCHDIMSVAHYVRTAQQSKGLDNDIHGPAIIIAGSGMANGGRVTHHLKRYISDEKTTVLFVGYQAMGTVGQKLIDGEPSVLIDDKKYVVRAEIGKLDMFSAHADYGEILDWLSGLEKAPKKIFLSHGESEAEKKLKELIEEKFSWVVIIPKHAESFNLE